MRGRVRSGIDYFRFVYGSEWAYFLALFAVLIGLATGGLPEWVIITLASLGSTITIFQLVVDTVKLRQRWNMSELVINPGELNTFNFKGVQWADEDTRENFLSLESAKVFGENEKIWRSLSTNEAITNGARSIPIASAKKRYALPDYLRDIAPRALRKSGLVGKDGKPRAKPAVRFNGALCRISTEPSLALLSTGDDPDRVQQVIRLQRVSYYDGESSNELWHWSFETKIDASPPMSPGRRIPLEAAVDLDRRILQLDYSKMANIIGITLVAITSDQKVVMVRQGAHNSVTPGAFALSSSGSLDWKDVTRVQKRRGSATATSQVGPSLHDVLMEGMLRELREESLVEPREVVSESAEITGYFRWLSRGAKPEFTGIVRLSASSTDLMKRSVRGAERLYTDSHAFVPVELLTAAGQGRADWEEPLKPLRECLVAAVPGIEHWSDVSFAASGAAAWLAARDFVRANGSYLSGDDASHNAGTSTS